MHRDWRSAWKCRPEPVHTAWNSSACRSYSSAEALCYSDPHVDDGVVVLLVRRTRNRIEGSNLDLRLPTGQLIFVRQGELDCVQFKGVKHWRRRKVCVIRVQDVGELAMMFAGLGLLW